MAAPRSPHTPDCSIAGCDRPRRAHGYCMAHYKRWKAGDLDMARPFWKAATSCTVEGCDRTDMHGRAMCELHYQRWRAWGDPLRARRKDPYQGFINSEGYKIIFVDKKPRLEHRERMAQAIGRPLLKSETVHHKNGQRADNRRVNLELWSNSQPSGQRVEDKVMWAREILETYGYMFV